MPDERIDQLVAILDAKSLNYIEVIPFHLDAEEYDDQEEDDDEDETD